MRSIGPEIDDEKAGSGVHDVANFLEQCFVLLGCVPVNDISEDSHVVSRRDVIPEEVALVDSDAGRSCARCDPLRGKGVTAGSSKSVPFRNR